MNKKKKIIFMAGPILLILIVIFGLWAIGGKGSDKAGENTESEKTEEGPTVFSIRDINMVTSNEKDLRQYGETISNILKSLSTPSENEINLVMAVYKERDLVSLGKITTRKNIYQTILDKLKIIQVPSNMAKLHVELLNSTSQIVSDLSVMENITLDQIKALETAQKYPEHLMFFYNSVNNLSNAFLEKNILFEDETAIDIHVNL